MPLVSVVIPTYNRADLLRETLDSVLCQTVTDIEIIVADDGSTDDTAAVVAAYGSRVRYVRQVHSGQDGAARNLGVRVSQGKYVAFVDSDDLWRPEKLHRQLELIEGHSHIGMVYSDARFFESATGRTAYYMSQVRPFRHGRIAEQLIMGNFIATSSTMIRRDTLKSVGEFSEEPGIRPNDWEMWLRVAAVSSIACCPVPLVDYRLHQSRLTHNEDPVHFVRSHLEVVEHACRFRPAIYAPLRHRAIAIQYMHAGGMCAATGRIHEARSMYAQAIHRDPALLAAYPYLAATLLGERFATSLVHLYLARQRRSPARSRHKGEG
jgi:glycosyltransferase involved in cell wall biosynthesis